MAEGMSAMANGETHAALQHFDFALVVGNLRGAPRRQTERMPDRVGVHEAVIGIRLEVEALGASREDSRLCMMGLTANNVIPHGDTIAGLKYIGRRFVADVARAENLRHRSFMGRLGMQISIARETATELRQVRSTKQLA